MSEITVYNPSTLGKPLGQYSQITRVKASEFLFVAGQLAVNQEGEIVGVDDFRAQCKQIFSNIGLALESADATWANIVQFTTYLVHSQDIPKFMEFRRAEFPALFKAHPFPPNTLLMIDRLVDERCLIEVQAIAAI